MGRTSVVMCILTTRKVITNMVSDLMNFIELFLVSIGLAMDAFAVSVCKGLSMKKLYFSHMFIVGIYFGLFQGFMPMIGYFLGSVFEKIIISVDHWVAFVLLVLIGFNMIKETFSNDEFDDKVNFKAMFPLAIATSIDALSVGITFAFLRVNIFLSVLIIGIITFVISFIGVSVGNRFGSKYRALAQKVGGIILIFMGIKILVEHLGLI